MLKQSLWSLYLQCSRLVQPSEGGAGSGHPSRHCAADVKIVGEVLFHDLRCVKL